MIGRKQGPNVRKCSPVRVVSAARRSSLGREIFERGASDTGEEAWRRGEHAGGGGGVSTASRLMRRNVKDGVGKTGIGYQPGSSGVGKGALREKRAYEKEGRA